MFQRITLFSVLLLLGACSVDRPPTRMFVESIGSDSELVMLAEGQRYQVRLCGVYVAPEHEAQAKKLLQSLLGQQAEERGVKVVPVRSKGNDITAEVFSPTADPNEEKSFSGELLVAGLAQNTEDDCPNREAFRAIEQDARERRVGIWK